MLYMVLVVPREMRETNQVARTNFKFDSRNKFSKITGDWQDNWDFIRLMRNAISHANFDMDQKGEYRFWNIGQQGQKNFEVSIMHSDLFEFISEIGHYYINNYPEQGE